MPGLRAVFLDRDGVINHSVIRGGRPYPPDSLENVRLIDGAVHSIRLLANVGYLLIGVTNQPDVARGTQSRHKVDEINEYIKSTLPVANIFTCYHDDNDACECRKPKPGLILQSAEFYGVDLLNSWMVGDRWKDISAGRAAGLKTVFVDYHYDEVYRGPCPDTIIEDLGMLADVILNSLK